MLTVGALVAGVIYALVVYLMEPGRLLAMPVRASPSIVVPAHMDL